MASTWNWKRHDTAPALTGIIEDSSGAAVDLTGCSVKFIMVAADANGNPVTGTPKIDTSATVTDAATGAVSYQPVTGDTDTAGTFLAEFEVTYGSGNKETFPDPGYLTIIITADLDDA